ncbi:hypothetical protein ACTFIZ_007535 [Dictyostelium cf. discoideum]
MSFNYWDQSFPIPREVKLEISHWLTVLNQWNGKEISLFPSYDYVLTTDASESGAGATLKKGNKVIKTWSFQWSSTQSNMSSNRREMLALLMAYQALWWSDTRTISSVRTTLETMPQEESQLDWRAYSRILQCKNRPPQPSFRDESQIIQSNQELQLATEERSVQPHPTSIRSNTDGSIRISHEPSNDQLLSNQNECTPHRLESMETMSGVPSTNTFALYPGEDELIQFEEGFYNTDLSNLEISNMVSDDSSTSSSSSTSHVSSSSGTYQEVLTKQSVESIPIQIQQQEDVGQIQATAEGPQDISYPAIAERLQKVADVLRANDAVASLVVSASDSNSGRFFIGLKAQNELRKLAQVLEGLRRDVSAVAGINVYFSPVQNLRLGGKQSKSRYQYILQSVEVDGLQEWADQLMSKLRADNTFRDVTISDSQLKGLESHLEIDRDKANTLAVNIEDVRSELYSAFGDRQVSTIYSPIDSYDVILRAVDQADESAFAKIFVRAKNGNLIPLNAFSTVTISINHQGQLQAITISFNLALGTAAEKIRAFGGQWPISY